MQRKDDIKLACLDIPLEGTAQLVCPFCKGGSTGERSLNVRRVEAGILYNCKRASCGKHGIVGSRYTRDHTRKYKDHKTNHYQGITEELPEEVYNKMFGVYGIPMSTVLAEGVRYCSGLDRVYFPVYDYRGYCIGEVLKAANGQKPKVLINKFSIDVPFWHFSLITVVEHRLSEKLILVEDQTSSIKVTEVAPCAALLGTQLSDSILNQLRQFNLREVVVFMDGDRAGTLASNRIVRQLRPFFSSIRAIRPPAGLDPKDMSYNQIRNII